MAFRYVLPLAFVALASSHAIDDRHVSLQIGPQGDVLDGSNPHRLSLLRREASKDKAEPSKPLRVAVVGSGPSASAAVVHLKRQLGKSVHVSVFEAHGKVGGVMTSTQWGKDKDWNKGYVDSGMVVSTRFLYPNYFEFLDSEGIPTERREMKIRMVGAPLPGDAVFKEAFREFYEDLLSFPGTFADFKEARQGTTNVAARWFLFENKLMSKAHFEFMTLDMGSPTSHVANCLSFLNITGKSYYDAPVGGYAQTAEAAMAHADRLKTGSMVSKVKPLGSSGRVQLSWKPTQGGDLGSVLQDADSETFDKVILTVPPGQLLKILDFSLLDQKAKEMLSLLPNATVSEFEHAITVHNHKGHIHGRSEDDVAFYEYVNASLLSIPEKFAKDFSHVINTYPNGLRPPYVTFFNAFCDYSCRRSYVPKEAVLTEYNHSSFIHTGQIQRDQVRKFLKKMSGVGGLHYAGVWTSDGRFAEGTWTTGQRVSMEVTGRDVKSYPFKSLCAKRSFLRYGLWFRHNSSQEATLGPVHPSCYQHTEQEPSYFESLKAYQSFYDGVDRGAFLKNYQVKMPILDETGSVADESATDDDINDIW
eukprot:TRINITY_DN20252_c2_g3_i1.p1 TRINITY_DN20252_c2_g3~~TRINITY_DN20252_c2_g3_i1.p1  ORF type:complete len:588 (+),score=95.73 TRINITY_DN20252_c2_g3_i1:81-1844(+)